MQHLQWFPGHMTAAMRMMEQSLKAVDGVIIVLDARAPAASENKKLNKLFENKKVLFALNKCDLVEKKDVTRSLENLRAQNRAAVAVSAADKKSTDKLYAAVFSLLSEKLERNKAKGIFKPLRVMVAGIPNTGKSTIINALAGGKKAATGDKAGVTRGKQWIRIGALELLDTPGTMPPAFENQVMAKHLAYIGSMNDANLDFTDLAFEFIAEIKGKYPELLKERYSLSDVKTEPLEIMNEICLNRGFLLKGGEYDYERCASAVIDDFRKGRTGKIFLE